MIIGASVKRKEDPRLLTGTGRYVDDVHLPGMLHAVIVRSPHAHATIRAVDDSAARAAAGVVTVVTAADLGDVKPIPIRLGPKASLAPFLQPPLARARVRYVGEPVAVVVAENRYLAEDAAEAVSVDYAASPPVHDAEQAQRDDTPLLHAPSSGNVFDLLETVVGDPSAALAGAAVRVQRRFTVQRHAAVPMETRGLVATRDATTGLLTVWGPTKVPHFNRSVLADLLRYPIERIRFIEPDVGGGFGARGEFYPEDFLIPWAAVRLNRPIKWIEDRREHLVATNHSREQIHEIEIGATRDGRIVAIVDHITVDMGAYLRTHGITVPELTGAMLPGPYAVPNYAVRISCVATNKTPTGTYRAPGRFEGNFVRERAVDMLALAAGLAPDEVRRRNFIPPDAFPYDVGTFALGEPITYDVGVYVSTLRRAMSDVGYERWRDEQRRARAQGRYIGLGLACFVEKAGPGPFETARVEVGVDGGVTVFSGGASVGQGLETVLAQICAQELGVPYDDVTVRHGDTAEIAEGVGAWGSRLTVVGGAAVMYAAQSVRQRLLDRAARWLEAPRQELVLDGGRAWVRGAPGRAVTVRELAAGAGAGAGGDTGLSASHKFHVTKMTYPYGAHVAVVDVDVDTGQIRVLDYAIAYDVGRAVNPRLVRGQLEGGLAQGLGGALLEEFVYGDDGQMLSGTFMDYLLPTAMEMPDRVAVAILEETPTPLNPLGVKGAGEGGTAAAGAAIANAVADALRPLGVEIASLPLSPERVLAAIRDVRSGGARAVDAPRA